MHSVRLAKVLIISEAGFSVFKLLLSFTQVPYLHCFVFQSRLVTQVASKYGKITSLNFSVPTLCLEKTKFYYQSKMTNPQFFQTARMTSSR